MNIEKNEKWRKGVSWLEVNWNGVQWCNFYEHRNGP